MMDKADIKPLYRLSKNEFIDRLGTMIPDAVSREKIYTDADTLLEAASLIDELSSALWHSVQAFPPTDLIDEIKDLCFNFQALSTYIHKSMKAIFDHAE